MPTYTSTSVDIFEIPEKPKIEGFPPLFDDVNIAHRLGLKNRTLWFLINQRNEEKAYKCFGIPEFYEDGSFKKKRNIQAPLEEMKFAHKVLNGILSSIKLPDCIAAYVSGKSPAEAAEKHVRPSEWKEDKLLTPPNTPFFGDPRYKSCDRVSPEGAMGKLFYQPIVSVQLDITNYFNTIRASWVRKFFYHGVGYSHYVSAILATLCTVKKTDKKTGKPEWFLPQGSPISGALSNFVGYHMFGQKIEEYLKSESPDWIFTIYSDDITLTHPDLTISQEAVDRVKDNVIRIIQDASFKINDKKTKIRRSKHERLEVLGCVINEKLNLPKYVYNNAKCLMHNCKVNGWDSQKEVLGVQTDVNVVQYARGIKEYIKQVRPDLGAKLDSDFNEALRLHPLSTSSKIVLEGVTTNADFRPQS